MLLRPSHRAPGAAALLAALAIYGCGSTTSSGGTTGGSGGATATTTTTTTTATTATTTTATGGHGGAPGMMCPATPPQNGDACSGFAEGQQCNYGGGLDAGMVSATECQCANGAGEPTWSCGTEAAGTGTGVGGGATSSSSSG
jgi:hypothetical protein